MTQYQYEGLNLKDIENELRQINLPIKNLSFIGGDLDLELYLGALDFLVENKFKKSISNVCGEGVGAIPAMFFALGIPSSTGECLDDLNILCKLHEENFFSNLKNIKFNDKNALYSYLKSYSVNLNHESDQLILKFIRIFREKDINENVTFADLKLLSEIDNVYKNLSISMMILKNQEVSEFIFSFETTPSCRLVDAVRYAVGCSGGIPPIQVEGGISLDSSFIKCVGTNLYDNQLESLNIIYKTHDIVLLSKLKEFMADTLNDYRNFNQLSKDDIINYVNQFKHKNLDIDAQKILSVLNYYLILEQDPSVYEEYDIDESFARTIVFEKRIKVHEDDDYYRFSKDLMYYWYTKYSTEFVKRFDSIAGYANEQLKIILKKNTIIDKFILNQMVNINAILSKANSILTGLIRINTESNSSSKDLKNTINLNNFISTLNAKYTRRIVEFYSGSRLDLTSESISKFCINNVSDNIKMLNNMHILYVKECNNLIKYLKKIKKYVISLQEKTNSDEFENIFISFVSSTLATMNEVSSSDSSDANLININKLLLYKKFMDKLGDNYFTSNELDIIFKLSFEAAFHKTQFDSSVIWRELLALKLNHIKYILKNLKLTLTKYVKNYQSLLSEITNFTFNDEFNDSVINYLKVDASYNKFLNSLEQKLNSLMVNGLLEFDYMFNNKYVTLSLLNEDDRYQNFKDTVHTYFDSQISFYQQVWLKNFSNSFQLMSLDSSSVSRPSFLNFVSKNRDDLSFTAIIFKNYQDKNRYYSKLITSCMNSNSSAIDILESFDNDEDV